MKLLKSRINNEGKTIISNFFSLTILQAANYILPLIILPFLVRILGSDKFGLVMLAQSLAMFLKIAVDFGFIISGTREVSLARNDKNQLSEIFSAIMIIKAALTIIAFLLLILLVQLISRFRPDAIVYYLSFGIVIGHALFPVWFFQGIEKMKFVTFLNIFAKLIFTILIFVTVRDESDFILVPIFNSLGLIVAGLLGFYLSLKKVKLVKPRLKLIKKLIRESSSLFFGKLATNFYTTFNVLILGFFADNSIVGVYSSMEKLILAVKNGFSPIYQALFPWLAKQIDKKRVSIIKKLIPIIFVIGLIIMLVIFLFGKTILAFVYDDELINSYSNVFKILGSIGLFAGLNMLFTNLYFPAIKKYRIRMFIFIAAGIFNLFLSVILVFFNGIYGMAISVSITEFFLLLIGVLYFIKYSKLALNT